MAPRGRARKRSTRMDAAVDAMGNLGFDAEVVTRIVKELLDIYGGDEAWPFIEEYGYKELIDAILRDSETSKDGNLEKHESLQSEVANGSSNSLASRQACSEVGDFAPEVENSIIVKSPSSSVCTYVNNTGDMLLAIEDVNDSSRETRKYDSDQMTLIQMKRSKNTCNSSRIEMAKNTPNAASSLPSSKILKKPHDAPLNVTAKPSWEKNPCHASSSRAPPVLFPPNSPNPVTPHPPIRRHPCYGWIDSDDEDEPELVYLPAVGFADRPSQVSYFKTGTNKKDGARRPSRWDQKPETV